MANNQTNLIIKENIAVIEMCRPPVNALGEQLRNEIKAHIDLCEKNPNIKAIVLASGEAIFSGGADISEFKTGFKGESLASIQASLEQSKKITVALINKQALGGAAEIAVSCHYRVCDEQAKIGFPEVTLGLIPGAGGTQRLPRLVSFEASLEMMLTGKPVSAKKALQIGLVDHIVDSQSLREGGLSYVQSLIDDKAPLRPTCDNPVKLDGEDSKNWFDLATPWIKHTAKRVGPTAPQACFESLENALNTSFEIGLKEEQALFFKVVLSQESQALQYAFFAQRNATKQVETIDKKSLRLPTKVGVVGAGLMGGGIAMVMANAGVDVLITDMSQPNLDKGLEKIKENYLMSVKHGKLSQAEMDACLERIKGSIDMSNLKACDLVIEAVFEDMALKKQVFSSLNEICPKDTILATNTSALNVNEIASTVFNPERVLGLHFFSPAQVTKLLEVVRAEKTSDIVLETMLLFAKKIKKTPVVVGVCPGFVGNRLMFKYLKQANDMIMSGTSPAKVDQVIKSFGFPMGPFLMCDMVGLDLGWTMHDKPKEPRDILCHEGRLGQKVKAGFYDYPEGIRKPVPSPEVDAMMKSFAHSLGVSQEKLTDQEILERCLFSLINEGFKVLEEGVVSRPSDIDVIYLFGYGFPPFKGGPMYFAEQFGLHKVLETIEAFHVRYGDFWLPAPLLKRMVQENKKLKDWSIDDKMMKNV